MSKEKVLFYAKGNENCPEGLELQSAEPLSAEWRGESLRVRFPAEAKELEMIGWSSLFGGSPAGVSVRKVRWQGQEGYLVLGADWGLRVLDPQGEQLDPHLPLGWGLPVLWVEDLDDILSPEAQEVLDARA
jgi:hypothetical protein